MYASVTPTPFVLSESGDRITLRFNGISALDCSNCDDLGRAMLAVVENRVEPDLRIDLAEIDYLTSMALSQFLKLDHQVRSQGGRLTLANVRANVRKVFKLSRLDQVLNICDGAVAG